MKRRRASDKKLLTSWEIQLRSEGLYPLPYPKNHISLENLSDVAYEVEEYDWDFVDSIVEDIPWLTRRQKEVFALKCRGCSENQIADILRISRGTVSRTWRTIKKKIKKARCGETPGNNYL